MTRGLRREVSKEGRKAVAVNAASAYSVGGGVPRRCESGTDADEDDVTSDLGGRSCFAGDLVGGFCRSFHGF